MRQILLLVFLTVSLLVTAQSPQLMNYQAVVRNASGQPVVNNNNIKVRFTIHDGAPSGNIVFQEVATVSSNALGVINHSVGSIASLSNVNWGSGAKYLQVETDVNGGTNYTDMGTSQLLSVPYALYAEKANVPGLTGPTGPTGPQGAVGPTGPTGPAGSNATIPSLTQAQRDSITNPSTGLLIYNNVSGCFDYFNGSAWVDLAGKATLWYADNDNDGYGNTSVSTLSCKQPQGYVTVGGDCNDNNNNIHPGMPELCDGIDQNCNGQIDESLTQICYSGPPGTNGVGICQPGIQTCVNGSWGPCVGAVLPSVEICNGLDDNCNGIVDDGFDLFSDPTNCGGCGVVCPPGTICVGGSCQ